MNRPMHRTEPTSIEIFHRAAQNKTKMEVLKIQDYGPLLLKIIRFLTITSFIWQLIDRFLAWQIFCYIAE